MPEAIPDDGRLQEFDFTDHNKLNETYIISDDVFTEDFERIQKTKPAGNEQEIKVSQDVFLEEFDFSQRKKKQNKNKSHLVVWAVLIQKYYK